MKPAAALLVAIAGLSALATAAYGASDRTLLEATLADDNAAARLGRLAEADGDAAATRAFGRRLAADPEAAGAAALRLAADDGLKSIDEVSASARAEERRLQRLAGPAFDREFIRYMARQEASGVARLEGETHLGDPATADLVRRTLPVLQDNLKTAQGLARELSSRVYDATGPSPSPRVAAE
jgi:predicted outer membrane protein